MREEEEALEQAREEERLTGWVPCAGTSTIYWYTGVELTRSRGRYSDKKDVDLFTVDTVGDVEGELPYPCGVEEGCANHSIQWPSVCDASRNHSALSLS